MKENKDKAQKKIKANEVAEFILDAGVFLMASGAHSGRVWRNCKRMADHWGYHMNFNPTFTGIMVSVWDDKDSENAVTRYKTAPQNIVHLETLTQISHLSWEIADGKTEYDDARRDLEAIKNKAHYPFWLVALAVGVSCGCLCTLAGGSPVDAALAFLGIALDADANTRNAATLSSAHRQVVVAVEPTNEEWIAASHALSCLASGKAR